MTRLTETIIIGDGPAAWTLALALARQAPARVTVIEHPAPDDVDPFGPALFAAPPVRGRHAALGLDERAVTAGAVPVLGLSLEGFGDRPAFVPFGQTGADMGSVAFHQQLARLGRLDALEDHSLAARAARLRRFAPPSPDPASFLSTLDHGLSLDAESYAERLRRHALRAGAAARPGPVASAARDASGAVTAVTLDDGASVTGDLFLDASGPDPILAASPFRSWADDLPFDQLQVETEPDEQPPLHLTLTGACDRLDRLTPLPNRRVRARLTRSGPGDPFVPGRRQALWDRNVLAVGAAAHVLPPLGAGALHLIHRAAEHLIRLWPATADRAVEAREFNRLMGAEIEAERDFVLLLLRRHGAVLTEPAAHRLALFESRGRVSRREHEAGCTPGFLAAALLASGARPRRTDPLALALDTSMLAARADRVRDLATNAAASLPPYESPAP